MKNIAVLTLNTQKAYQPGFGPFMHGVLASQRYDFLLLQEANATVMSIISGADHSYAVLHPFDADLGADTGVCILYKKEFILKDILFTSFAKTNPAMPARGWGFVGGLFTVDGGDMLVGSVHLHSGIKISIRRKEIRMIKEKISHYGNNTQFIFAGDFNTGFPGEIFTIDNMFLPDFVRSSKNIGTTLDSRYTEKSSFLLNRVNSFFAHLGISFKFRTDHVYVDVHTMQNHHISCKTLPDRVSDHMAVEVVIALDLV